MKMFLILLVLCTAQSAFADLETVYAAETALCEDGEFPRTKEQSVVAVELDGNLSEATVDGKKFTLTLAGKAGESKRYMAVPQFESDMRQHFYIEIPDNRAQVVIYKSDFMAKDCGGGLIATQLRSTQSI